MTSAEFIASLAEMLEIDPDQIKLDSILKELPNWDSLATLSFVALADSKFGCLVKGTDLVKCRTVRDLAALIPDAIKD